MVAAIHLSVIIPTFNRWSSLQRTLDSLMRQTLSARYFEIIVVDDGSVDDTPACTDIHPAVHYLHQDHHGPAAARNAGAEIAHGDILVFIDDDCSAPQDWLTNVQKYFNSAEHILMGGATINCIPNNYWSFVHQFVIDFLQRTMNHGKAADPYLISSNMAIRKYAFERVNGFSLQYDRAGAEDRDLTLRAIEAGYRADFCPGIVIHHHHHLSLAGFIRQQFHYGRGSFHLYTLNRKMVSHPPWHVYLRLLSHCWSGSSVCTGIKNSAAVILSQACILCGFLSAACRFRTLSRL